ncbi:hypothetical protein PPL_09978 [Heterostelium album PN500]|uniref:Uncharacterized protein n=1 Tax=Heterostelium pallidum (strain ATCC 26659 / Pp 5 / PN500) TaxID=670386 RepID=D3BPT4_HETP5|nr:hypothetical protein PPL_09978 [Heterostelium album PN500]EFA76217.1 hypothetical protein PPL_09978 [Heterostelium album PN500]|eukprot:XP_020428350.1 hypothetical protein PPL_09978 [Heterostelium album PN500]
MTIVCYSDSIESSVGVVVFSKVSQCSFIPIFRLLHLKI